MLSGNLRQRSVPLSLPPTPIQMDLVPIKVNVCLFTTQGSPTLLHMFLFSGLPGSAGGVPQ